METKGRTTSEGGADVGVCDGCGAAGEALAPWRRYDQVRARRVGAEPPAPGRVVQSTRHSPRYDVRLTEFNLCPACHAAAAAEEEAGAKRGRRATAIMAIVALVVAVVSLAGPSFWPALIHRFSGQTAMDAAAERAASSPMSPYKPADLVPLNLTQPAPAARP